MQMLLSKRLLFYWNLNQLIRLIPNSNPNSATLIGIKKPTPKNLQNQQYTVTFAQAKSPGI